MPHVHEKGRGHGSKTAGVPLTSSLPFSLDSAVQALCSAFISSRRASFSTDSDRTSCWISGSLCNAKKSLSRLPNDRQVLQQPRSAFV